MPIRLIALLSVCLVPASVWAGEKIKICIPQFREEFLTLAVLEGLDKGFFKSAGLDADLVVTRKHGPHGMLKGAPGEIPQRLVGDHASAEQVADDSGCAFGASTIENFIFSGETRDKVSPLFVSMYGEGYDTQLIVPRNSPIKTVKDLKGRRLRMGLLPTHIAIHRLLKQEGLSLKDVEVNWKVDPPDVLAMFSAGELDAATTYVPTMPYMLASGQVRVLKSNIVRTMVLPAVPHSLLIVNRRFASASPETVKRFSAALKAAIAYIKRNPSDVIYAFKRHAQELGFHKWAVDRVIAEKAGSLVGEPSAVDLTLNSPARDAAIQAAEDYGRLIQSLGYLKTRPNLKGWFGEGLKPLAVSAN